jgi:hypothetical protein
MAVVDAPVVEHFHRLTSPSTWTVDDEEMRALAIGVDEIVTDRPDVLARMLDAAGVLLAALRDRASAAEDGNDGRDRWAPSPAEQPEYRGAQRAAGARDPQRYGRDAAEPHRGRRTEHPSYAGGSGLRRGEDCPRCPARAVRQRYALVPRPRSAAIVARRCGPSAGASAAAAVGRDAAHQPCRRTSRGGPSAAKRPLPGERGSSPQ